MGGWEMGQKKKLLREIKWQGEELLDSLSDEELPTAYVWGLKIRELVVRLKFRVLARKSETTSPDADGRQDA
jgi:hypothetical protein